eukprot:422797-Amphidinium_carterae.1
MALPKNPSIEVPADDKCLTCWELWRASFQMYSWTELCAKMQAEKEVQKAWKEALQCKEDPSKRNFELQDVQSQREFAFEVSRHFVVLSMQELKKITGMAKIPKAVLQFIPSIMVADDYGDGQEEFWLFKNPDMPYRTAELKSLQKHSVSASRMAQQSHMWAEQGNQMMKHSQEHTLKETGMTNVLEKLQYLVSVDEFLEKKVKKEIDGEERDSGELEEDAEGKVEEPAPLLFGPAAAALQPAWPSLSHAAWPPSSSFGLPSAKPKVSPDSKQVKSTSKLVRSSSSAVLNDGCSTVADSMDGNMDKGACLEHDVRQYSPRDLVAKWKEKVSLDSCLKGIVDGRSLQGLKRAQLRLSSSENTEDQSCGAILKNYLGMAEMAKSLAEGQVKHLSIDEIKAAVAKLQENGVSITYKIKCDIVERSCLQLSKGRKYRELFDTINPFKEQLPWNIDMPTVQSLGGSEVECISTFESICLKAVLLPSLKMGQSSASDLEAFCTYAVEDLRQVDTLELGDNAASSISDIMTVMNTIVAILQETVEVQHRDSVMRVKQHMGSSRKTLVSQVAAAIQSNEYFNLKLEAYLQDLPAHLECATDLENALASADTWTEITEENTQQVLTTFANLARFKQVLRAATVQYLEDKLQSQLVDLGKKVLAEAVITWPMDVNLQQMKMDIAELVTREGHAILYKKLQEDCKGIVELGAQTTLTCLQPCLKSMEANLQGLPPSHVHGDLKDTLLSKVIPIIMEVMSQSIIVAITTEQKVAGDLLLIHQCLQKMTLPLGCIVELMADSVEHANAVVEASCKNYEGSSEPCLQKLEAIRVHQLRLADVSARVKAQAAGKPYAEMVSALLNTAVQQIQTCQVDGGKDMKAALLTIVDTHVGELTGYIQASYDAWEKAKLESKTLAALAQACKDGVLSLDPAEITVKSHNLDE